MDATDLFNLISEWHQGNDHIGLDPEGPVLPPPDPDQEVIETRSLFAPLENEIRADDLPDPPREILLRERMAALEFAALEDAREANTDVVQLNLFADLQLQGLVHRRYIRSSDRFTLIGEIVGDKPSRFVVTVRYDFILGKVSLSNGKHYHYQGRRGEAIEVREVILTGGAFCRMDEKPSWEKKIDSEREKRKGTDAATKLSNNCSMVDYDDGSVFDILVVYTAWARCAAEGGSAISRASCLSSYPSANDAIETGIEQAIDEMNDCFDNSNITAQVNLVHMQELQEDYTELGYTTGDLGRAQDPDDSYIDEIPVLRDYYCADMVVLVFNSNSAQGQAYGVADSVVELIDWADNAYCVVDQMGLVGASSNLFIFQHELGHVMGCAHKEDSPLGVFDYSLSYAFNGDPSNTQYDTIVEGVSPIQPPYRIPYYSNPDVTYDGSDTGVEDENDAARSINETALIIANWGCEKSPLLSLKESGQRVFSIDVQGNLVVEGNLTESATSPQLTPSAGDMWIVRDNLGAVVVRIDSDGDMFLKGSLVEDQSCPLTPSSDILVVKNDADGAVAFVDTSGNLKLTGSALIWNGGM